MSIEDQSWREEAKCRGMDPNLFHPERGTPYPEIVAVKRICEECPVRSPCLDFAYQNDGIGIWGGMSERERRINRIRWKREKGII